MESFETKNGRRSEGTDEKNTLNHSLFVNNDAVSESSSQSLNVNVRNAMFSNLIRTKEFFKYRKKTGSSQFYSSMSKLSHQWNKIVSEVNRISSSDNSSRGKNDVF